MMNRLIRISWASLFLCWSCWGPLAAARSLPRDDAEPSSGSPYSVALRLTKPSFNALKYYDQIYGKTTVMPELVATFDFLRLPWVAFSWGLGFGYYGATGDEVKHPDPAAPVASLEKTGGRLNLNLIPLRLQLGAQVNPFNTAWLALNGWIGYEELLYRETRASADAAGVTSSSADKGDYINDGWNSALIYGVGLMINISRIEEKPVRSMAYTTAFTHIYLAPFFEVSRSVKASTALISRRSVSPVNFERQAYGLAFVFATAPE